MHEANEVIQSMRVIVAHPQQQHSYRLATALKRSGMLCAYATTVYAKPHSLTAWVASLLPGVWRKKASSRRCNELDDEEVYQLVEMGGLLVLFCLNVSFARRWYPVMRRAVENRFAKKVARLAVKLNADVVVGYDGCSAPLYEEVKSVSPKTVCITDMSAANALFLKAVYEQDVRLKPEYAASLYSSWQRIWDPVDIARTKQEIALSDAFLCGSHFVARSLQYSSVDPKVCCICHYGVDTSAFPFQQRVCKSEEERLVFVYLGRVEECKGIAWLLDAFSTIPVYRAKLICIGAVNLPEEVLRRVPSNIEFTGVIQHEEVAKRLQEADVMLFPSLGDGFPLSVMEALSSGLPVVCTENTGSADCIVDGMNGFVIPVQDSGALRNRIEWFLDNRDQIPRMAAAARESVLGNDWDAYYRNAADAIKRLVNNALKAKDGFEQQSPVQA